MNKLLSFAVGNLLFFGGSVFATPIPASQIDWDTSTMEVDYSPELANSPTFSCFGQNTPPASETLTSLGFSDSTPSPDINNCFRQAGDYQVTINLTDTAGNTNTKNYSFTIKASEPDNTETVVTAASGCDDSDLGNSTLANNDDSCDLTLTLRDRFQNPVSQISEVKMYDQTTPYTDDANEDTATSFLEGLRWNGLPLPSNPGSTLSLTDGIGTITLKAIAPSILQVGDNLARLIAREMTFGVTTDNIDDNGNITAPGTINLSPIVDLAFRHLFELEPYVDEGVTFRLDSPDPQPFKIGITAHDGSGINLPQTGEVANRNPNIEHSNVEMDPPSIYTFNNWSDFPDVLISTAVRAKEGLTLDEDTGLSLSTKVNYEVSGSPVSYPAGGVNLADFNGAIDPVGDEIGYNINGILLRIVGVDIEGGVLGDLTRMMLQTSSGNQSQQVADVTATDIREKITENAFRLIRGASNIQDPPENDRYFRSEWFTAENNVVVVEGSLGISGTLPSGKNTLIIKNGNLSIYDNVTYSNPQNDSFGVILINEEHSTYPETGNIFVHPDVRHIAGTYYADGALMANNQTPPDINTIETAINTDEVISSGVEKNMNQLLFTGTLLSKNTIGGALIGDDPNNPSYFTPWETSLSGSEGKEKALKYDLHFVRRYTPELYNPVDPLDPIENRYNCAPDGGTDPFTNCDQNTNAFIIRIDRKVSELPPPGFEFGSTISR